jgi:hypothetical protein
MTTELDVLAIVGDRLTAHGIPFMLTGSFAMAHYAAPRMTRDLDIVAALRLQDVPQIAAAFSADFYIDADAAMEAIASERLFNLMHYGSGIKVDLIVRKSSEYRILEFSRRRHVEMGTISTWIVSREDLILSKLVWALDARSELQLRDVGQLLSGPMDDDLPAQVGTGPWRRIVARGIDAMNDTSDTVARLVSQRYAAMSPEERMRIAAALYETARAIVESSLPPGLTHEQKRYATAKRFYGDELPEAALVAYARYAD